MAVSANARNNTSDVALWNLETEDHKHLAQHPSYSTMGACLDFRYCMTGAQTEDCLRVWDISAKVNQPGMKLKKQLGVAEIWPMIDNPRSAGECFGCLLLFFFCFEVKSFSATPSV